MYLDAVSTNTLDSQVTVDGWHSNASAHGPWAHWNVTTISHHGSACCETLREWIGAIDCSALNGGSIYSGPRWLRERFGWGPSVYPIHWCDIGTMKKIDCGVHAALAHEIFTRRGVRSYRAQIVQEFSADATLQWHSQWNENQAVTDWINGRNIYHEAVAVTIADGNLKLWDPSAAVWIDPPKRAGGYGSLLSVKVTAREGTRPLQWGDHLLEPNHWLEMPNYRGSAN